MLVTGAPAAAEQWPDDVRQRGYQLCIEQVPPDDVVELDLTALQCACQILYLEKRASLEDIRGQREYDPKRRLDVLLERSSEECFKRRRSDPEGIRREAAESGLKM